ncbi:hypothetical protein TEA_003559 [Camellia sinensis var. sinensis]|uniref:Tyrosine decarboxylase n=1 Tax=Camellia sinensis var. sinensis TaxID=542762 RepID=A0A4S4D2W0_CAMSN|nr:hypothetical protein TEA_003559 [Camellia sinensis var. sinensis]
MLPFFNFAFSCSYCGLHQYHLLRTLNCTTAHACTRVHLLALSFSSRYKWSIEAILMDLNKISLKVGTTSSTAVDPLLVLGKITKSNGMWFHVDAAYAGSACICPEYRHYIDGIEEADSYNMNAHKWFLTNFDCSALWVKECSDSVTLNKPRVPKKQSKAPSTLAQSLKLWMVLRLYGLENLQSYIRNHIELAKHFEELVSQDPRFQVVAPRKFSLVCFCLLPPHNNEDCANKLNHDLLDAVNSTGKLFISHTVLSGKYTLRFAVGAPLTEERHVNAAWKVLQGKASVLLQSL